MPQNSNFRLTCVHRFFASNGIFDYPAVIDFFQKMEVTVIAPNHSGDPLGSMFGQMGSHWVEKMSQNRKKLPCPKIRIFGHRFFAKNGSYG